jgi:hypothetical protein
MQRATQTGAGHCRPARGTRCVVVDTDPVCRQLIKDVKWLVAADQKQDFPRAMDEPPFFGAKVLGSKGELNCEH